MGNIPEASADSILADTGRPLLHLIQHLTGMETSFVTMIEWGSQHQDVVLSLNTGEISVKEGGRVDWRDSLCRSMFLAGCVQSNDVAHAVPGAAAAHVLGMRSFVAVPILQGDVAIGTVCGASARAVELTPDQIVSLELIASSLRQLVETRAELQRAQRRAEAAAREAEAYQEAAQQLTVLANTDPLTGLLNRRAFMSGWEEALARSGRRGFPLGLLLVDLDSFKAVNDSSGHAAGDAILVQAAAALKANANSSDLVARLGGDEFAVVVTHGDAAALMQMALAIQGTFADLMREAGEPTSMSIGIASSDHVGRHDLLAAADTALYSSKAAGGNCARLAEGVAADSSQP